jgi:hypothetical protein
MKAGGTSMFRWLAVAMQRTAAGRSQKPFCAKAGTRLSGCSRLDVVWLLRPAITIADVYEALPDVGEDRCVTERV